MEERIVEFIAGLRAAGVRVSVAENADAFRAIALLGVKDRETFRAALQATLIKEPQDIETFECLFPLYFSVGAPPLLKPDEGLSPEDQALLQAALRALAGDLSPLLRWLLQGVNPSPAEMEQLGRQAGLPNADHPIQQRWLTRRILQALGWERLAEAIQQLLEQLATAGMSPEAVQQVAATLGANQTALEEQVNQFVGESIARQAARRQPRQPRPDLMHRPFQALSEAEVAELRHQVRRLAAQLRSRVALRLRKGKTGTLDPRRTLRVNLRYQSVPLELRFRQRHLKPKLVLLCDVSTSVRHCAEFLLYLTYELQDQVARARSFAFIDDIHEISAPFNEHRPAVAVPLVLDALPPGYYNTNLGYALHHFCQDYLDAVDHRTTVIVLGDGRNNYNNPRLDLMDLLKRRARRVLWFNPESPGLWGTGDSDMLSYYPYCHAVHQTSNLAQLAEAVEKLFDYR